MSLKDQAARAACDRANDPAVQAQLQVAARVAGERYFASWCKKMGIESQPSLTWNDHWCDGNSRFTASTFYRFEYDGYKFRGYCQYNAATNAHASSVSNGIEIAVREGGGIVIDYRPADTTGQLLAGIAKIERRNKFVPKWLQRLM